MTLREKVDDIVGQEVKFIWFLLLHTTLRGSTRSSMTAKATTISLRTPSFWRTVRSLSDTLYSATCFAVLGMSLVTQPRFWQKICLGWKFIIYDVPLLCEFFRTILTGEKVDRNWQRFYASNRSEKHSPQLRHLCLSTYSTIHTPP